jgi:hypothetical protein
MFLTAACAVLLLSAFATAQWPGEHGRREHPAYLRALSDLREARAQLGQPGNDEEQRALVAIDQTIQELKAAAIDDGRPADYLPPVDAIPDRANRLQRVSDLLDRAHNDIEQGEVEGSIRGLRDRADGHLNDARHAIGHVLQRERERHEHRY